MLNCSTHILNKIINPCRRRVDSLLQGTYVLPSLLCFRSLGLVLVVLSRNEVSQPFAIYTSTPRAPRVDWSKRFHHHFVDYPDILILAGLEL